ncbi:hypothetical protein KIPB_011466, partial [Kipferlia bialata]|eukprot:g11466.t1
MCPLVEGMDPIPQTERDILFGILERYTAVLSDSSSCLIVDFEGEQPGMTGELNCAQFSYTDKYTLDTDGDLTYSGRPSPGSTGSGDEYVTPTVGLLVDMRCPEMVKRVVRPLLDSATIGKIGWGAEGDLYSLIHQRRPIRLGINPQAYIDLQTVFNDGVYKTGLDKALRGLQRSWRTELRRLPAKDAVDWDRYHCRNLRAMPLPFSAHLTQYSCDDLHRIELVVVARAGVTQECYSLASAQIDSEALVERVQRDTEGYAWVEIEKKYRYHKSNSKHRVLAKDIMLAKHFRALRQRGGTTRGLMATLEATVERNVALSNATIPDGLGYKEVDAAERERILAAPTFNVS